MLLPSARDSQSFKSLPIDKRQDTLEMHRLMDPARRIGEWRRSLEANGTWQSRRIHPASFKIRYPERLFAERQEGAAIVRFIVDSTGKARPDSWTVVQTSRPEFAAALKKMLDGTWTPSTNAGQPVCDLVQHYVRFEIDGRDPNRVMAYIVIMNE